MDHAARAAVFYFLIVFAFGFVLGTLRLLVLIPAFGEIGAVLAEVPVMLAVSWWVARWLIGRFSVPAGLGARGGMGALAFGLLMLGEGLLGWLGFGRGLAEQLAAMGTQAGALGLAGQVGFGIIPILVGSARS